MRLIQVLTTFVAAVAASPMPEPVTTANPASVFCTAVKAIVTKAKAQSTATVYCSSLLGIKTATVTTTPTSTS